MMKLFTWLTFIFSAIFVSLGHAISKKLKKEVSVDD